MPQLKGVEKVEFFLSLRRRQIILETAQSVWLLMLKLYGVNGYEDEVQHVPTYRLSKFLSDSGCLFRFFSIQSYADRWKDINYTNDNTRVTY